MQVGDIVWFDPNKSNDWGAFTCCGLAHTEPFKVRIASISDGGALEVIPILFGGAPEGFLRGEHQIVQESQLSEDYPDKSAASEAHSADILWLIEQLEWLSVEQKKISKKELLALFKESTNV